LATVGWITDKNGDGAPHFSLEVVNADLHSYGQYNWFFRLRNCGQRTARDIQVDPIVSKRNFHALRLSSVSSLAKDEMVPLTFRAGADDDWTINGVVKHLLLFCEDNPLKESNLSYPVTIRFLDGGKRLEEHHVLECEPILPAGVRMKVYPR
jgi:hypothetical protein